MDPDLHELFVCRRHVVTAADLADSGVSPRRIRQLVAQGHVVRLAKGAYADGAQMRGADAPQRHLLRARGVLNLMPPGVALSHHSAAIAWSMPWIGAIPARVHLARVGSGQHRRASAYTIHRSLPGAQMHQVGGIPTVEPAYALLGVAADHGLRATVVALDGALRAATLGAPRIAEVLAECNGWPGRPILARAMGLTDPLCESPGESLTRLLLRSLGIPARSQVKIEASGPAFSARVDFLLETHPVVIEFDGLVKYGSVDDAANRRALAAEKLREDRLRSLGYEVVRLVWADLRNPEVVRHRIEEACRRSVKVA